MAGDDWDDGARLIPALSKAGMAMMWIG